MIRKYLLPALAVAGVILGIMTAMRSSSTTPPAAPLSEAPQPPYQAFVAGAGIVESSSENIATGTSVPGIVSQIFVKTGSNVKANAPLFTIDDRALVSELALREASIKVAEARLADARDTLRFSEGLVEKSAVSVEETTRHRNAVRIAEAELAMARAQLGVTKTELERLTVRASVDGQVLQLKVHPGEFAPTGVLATPLVMLGNVDKLHVRVDVDENDAWRIKPGAIATGYLRGNKEITTELKFVRFEPYVVPKKSLTGDSTERVDTRVLQIIYSFDRGDLPLYVGQQMDVFIDAPERTIAPQTKPGRL